MTLDQFIARFAEEFDETPKDQFTPSTDYKSLDEWGSLMALSIIAMIDEEFEKRLTGADLRSETTLEELYNLVKAK